MTEQLSDQSLENLAAPGGPTVSPQAAAALLARIDAVLDELYAMRQTVRQRARQKTILCVRLPWHSRSGQRKGSGLQGHPPRLYQ